MEKNNNLKSKSLPFENKIFQNASLKVSIVLCLQTMQILLAKQVSHFFLIKLESMLQTNSKIT